MALLPWNMKDLYALSLRTEGWFRMIGDIIAQRWYVKGFPFDHPVFDPETQALEGKTAIVTGANTGLGFETAHWLAEAGATVILACRSVQKAHNAKQQIIDSVPDAHLVPVKLDLADLQNVRDFVDSYKQSGRQLHILVLNAGVMCVEKEIPEKHFMVNHLAHALLTILLIPVLEKHATPESHGRVISISSIAALTSELILDDMSYLKRKYRPFQAYANSKLCNILFTLALAKRLKATNVDINAVHPGECATNIARHIAREEGLNKYIAKNMLLTARESAMTVMYAAAAKEVEGISGKVFQLVDKELKIPEALTKDEDVETLWMLTLEQTGISGAEGSIIQAEI